MIHLFSFLCLCLSTCMCMYHVYAWFLQKAEEGLRTPGTGVTHVCVLPHGYLDLNMGLLQEHQVFVVTETSLQSKAIAFICLFCFLSISRSINTLSLSGLISPFIPTKWAFAINVLLKRGGAGLNLSHTDWDSFLFLSYFILCLSAHVCTIYVQEPKEVRISEEWLGNWLL